MKALPPPIPFEPVTPAEYVRLRQLPGCLIYHSGASLGGTDPKPWAAFYRRPATGEIFVAVEHSGQVSIRRFSIRRREGLSSSDLNHAYALACEMAGLP